MLNVSFWTIVSAVLFVNFVAVGGYFLISAITYTITEWKINSKVERMTEGIEIV